ncbi:transcriptional regulator [Methanocaldococcus infernus]
MIFNSEVRIKILALLYGMEYCEFSYLREKLKVSPGNLEHHLKILEKEGLVIIKKAITKKGIRTVVKITEKGKEEFKKFLGEILNLTNLKEGK